MPSPGDPWVRATWDVVGAPDTVVALTTIRRGGVSRGRYAEFNLAPHVGDAAEAVTANRRALQAALGLTRVQWLNQVHGTRCVAAGQASVGTVPEADSAWTSERRIALAVMTADCLPVVFSRDDGKAVAIAHAGWRGLVGGVLRSTLQAVPGDPSAMVAWIGPAIGAAAYEVGEDVALAVRGMAGMQDEFHRFLLPGARVGKYQLDLAGLAAAQLRRLGVERVCGGDICVHEDRRFYSYRRDAATGRMATLVWMA